MAFADEGARRRGVCQRKMIFQAALGAMRIFPRTAAHVDDAGLLVRVDRDDLAPLAQPGEGGREGSGARPRAFDAQGGVAPRHHLDSAAHGLLLARSAELAATLCLLRSTKNLYDQ